MSIDERLQVLTLNVESLHARCRELHASALKHDEQIAKTDEQMARTEEQMARTEEQMARTDQRIAALAAQSDILTGLTIQVQQMALRLGDGPAQKTCEGTKFT